MWFGIEKRQKIGFHSAKFGIDDSRLYPGYSCEGESWNGWACPFFTFEVALEIATSMYPTTKDEHFRYEEMTDSFLFFSKSDEEYDLDAGEIYQPYECTGADIVVNGQVIHVYDIGAGAWCWEEEEPREKIYCASCGVQIDFGANYLEAKHPIHGEPVQFCGSDCAGNYLVPILCDSKQLSGE
jgi:hypothetical protein